MAKVYGTIVQKGVSGSITQKGVRGSIVQKGVAGTIVESGVSGQEYCDEAMAYFLRMDIEPSLGLMILINILFEALISYNYWNRIKVGYLLNLHNEQSSLLNIKGDDDFNMIAYNSPEFQAYKGFKGASGKYLGGVGNYKLSQLGLDVENFSIMGYSKEWLSGNYLFGVGGNSQGAYILPGLSGGACQLSAYVSDKLPTAGSYVYGDDYLAIQRNSATNKQLIAGENYGDYEVGVFRDADTSGFSTTRAYDILVGYGVYQPSWQGGNFIAEAFTEAEHLILRGLFNDFKNNVYNLT